MKIAFKYELRNTLSDEALSVGCNEAAMQIMLIYE